MEYEYNKPSESIYTLPTLVKENRYWSISVNAEEGYYETEYGVIGTKKPVKKRRVIKLNESGRNMIDQCWLEARQEHKKKRQNDYRIPQESLEKTSSTALISTPSTDAYDDLADEIAACDLTACSSPDAPPLFNDNKVRLPMLAQQLAKRLKTKKGVTFPLALQPKANGVRGLFVKTSSGVLIYSRTLHNYFFMNALRAAVDEVLKKAPSLVLDGEIYATGVAGQDITSIATQKTEPHASEHLACLHVFDCYDSLRPSLIYSERRKILEELIPRRGEKVVLMPETIVKSMAELEAVHETYRGVWEGSMLRVLTAPYSHKRSNDLLKHKFDKEMDTLIIAIERTDGGDAILTLRMEDGKTLTHRPEGTVQDKESWLTDPSMVIGRIYSFSYTHLTEAGIPLAIHDGMIRFDLPK